jgi:site-specific recombinase XerD
MTLRELLKDRVAPLKNLCDRTTAMYEATLDRFRDYLGHEPTVDDLDDLTAAKFLRWRQTTQHSKYKMISPASLAKDSAHLRSLWTWLAKKRWKKSNGELLEFPDYARPRVPSPALWPTRPTSSAPWCEPPGTEKGPLRASQRPGTG